MPDWAQWTIEEWNERLLFHFFKKHDPDDGPISTLLVTSEELAAVTGDTQADPKAVRDRFVDAVLSELPESTDLLAHAFESPFSPESSDILPPYVAHLVLTCVAAAESSEELASESSYIQRLRELTRNRCNDRVLHFLTPLWERLARWLARQPCYRPIILPDVGSHTRIGYSEKLAFPDRRDQREFCALLREHGFNGEEPPPAKIVSVVASARGRFRRGFLDAHDDFRRRLGNATNGDRRQLRAHPFWSAAIDAVMRGRAADERTLGAVRIQLVATWDGDAFEPYLLSDAQVGRLPVGTQLRPLETSAPPWRFYLAPADGGPSRYVLNGFLNGTVRIPRLTALMEQGVLPFFPASADYLELAGSREEIGRAEFALVHSRALADVLRFFAGNVVDGIRFGADWTLVAGLRVRHVPPDELDDSALRRCWMLQDVLPTVRIRMIEGIRTEDGYLGLAEVLPKLTATGAADLSMMQGEVCLALKQVSSGIWSMPACFVQGAVTFRATDEHGATLDLLTVRFSASPETENFKPIAEARSYYAETADGTCLAADVVGEGSRESQPDMGRQLGQIIFLGEGQGQFVAKENDAAWVVSKSGCYREIRQAKSSKGGCVPPFRATNPGLRRLWRTLLDQSFVASDDYLTRESRSAVRRRLADRQQLVLKEYSVADSPVEFQPDLPDPIPAVKKIAAALAGRAANRAGVPFSEWCFFIEKFAGVQGYSQIEAITRSWSEAGFIDVLIFARWRSKFVYPIPPKLMIYRSGEAFIGYLSGLALPTTKSLLIRLAEEHGIHCSERKSFSRHTPSTLVLASGDFDALTRVAAAGGTQVAWAALDFPKCIPAALESNTPLPTNYDLRKRIADWSLLPAHASGRDVRLTYWSRDDRPAFWSVSSQAGALGWSYQKNAARWIACSADGIAPIAAKGIHEISAVHAFLPLPIARRVAMLGPALPGSPDAAKGTAGYSYAFFTGQFRDEILSFASTLQRRSTL